MESQQILSDEGKKRLEDITLAAFHNLLIDTTNALTKQLQDNAATLSGIQHATAIKIIEQIHKGDLESQAASNNQTGAT